MAAIKFVAFRTMLEAELGETSARFRTLLLQWTNAAYHRICRRRPWHWLEATKTGYSHAALSASFALINSTVWQARRIFDLADTTAAPHRFLVNMGERQFWGQGLDSTTTGDPTHFRVWAGYVYLYPIPSSIRTLRFRYVQEDGDLNTSDNTGLGTELLIPIEEIDMLYASVLAEAYRWLDDSRYGSQVQIAEQKIQDAEARDYRDPGIIESPAMSSGGSCDLEVIVSRIVTP